MPAGSSRRRSTATGCLAYRDKGRVRLVSHYGVNHTRRFQDIARAVSKFSARTLVLDGEVAIYDDQLRSRFEWLRERDSGAVATLPLLMVFDLFYRDGRDLTRRPLRERGGRLEDIVGGSELLFPVRRLAADGLVAWKQVVEAAMRATSPRTRPADTRGARRDGG